jgi:alpha-1,2-mannosyltransferase
VFLVLLVALDLVHRRGWKGWGLGLAIAIKLTPAGVPALARGDPQRGNGSGRRSPGCPAPPSLGLVLLWPSASDYMFRASRDTTRFGANDIPGNQSVRGMLLRLFGPDGVQHAERAWLLCAVVLVAVGTYQAWRCERAGNRLAAVGVPRGAVGRGVTDLVGASPGVAGVPDRGAGRRRALAPGRRGGQRC